MSFLLNKRIFITSLIAASSITQAQPEEGFTIAPSIGYYNMDNHRGIKNDTALSLGLGYQFGNPWAVEFVYLNADSKTSTGSTSVDADQFRLDGLYHLEERNQFTPYLAAGVGTTDLSPGSNNALINAGGGLKYALNDTLSLRGDFRLIKDIEDHELDNLTTIGLHFVFGGDLVDKSGLKEKFAEAVEEKKPEYEEEVAAIKEQVEEKIADAEEKIAEVKVENTDTDNDGIKDESDLCLATSANVSVDATGCALDTDKDGIANHLDMCANSASGAKVDEKGCYLVLESQKSVRLDVQFGNNSIVVDQKYYTQIEEVADFLTEYPNTNAIIEGHTDDRGSASYNQAISEKRAQAIVDVLVNDFGISAERVSAIGYGEEQPLLNNDTESNRSINRRVTAVISSNEA
ncbi:flagellar motor protein MotB [Marinomonas ushuaiensis DSM 15871]|uniref:Flagellar motor protein MotB n=1 Tax=Marinomonas ushuaiensis DSM 15871 TaxID=1122207 RepID=X7EB68_9GAMM|nr:OmpA family protein [Marinomonas ushuaiensis]ETX12348.1 flagellar motor protein MotB [Marinomonas ushuaiensis DSM 15871]